ncbi:hypothetical protein [Methylomonas koyamae]|uniref:hypothetical protein n=1 Tax=Methylomonas koyamae TaxID=702114 RepID=UPI0012F6EE71|nr:hypothetical protein [Methylomonas koyamae]
MPIVVNIDRPSAIQQLLMLLEADVFLNRFGNAFLAGFGLGVNQKLLQNRIIQGGSGFHGTTF